MLKLVPEARTLLAKANGIVIPPPPDTLQVTSFPKEVEVGQSFRIEGTAAAADKGKKLTVLIDNQFPLDDIKIEEGGE